MTQFHVGTAGWSYLRWDKEFYPKGTKEKLGFYASCFNAVELNNSFYHIPTAEQLADWENQVPASFRFAAKAWRTITHTQKLKDVAETLPPLLEAFQLQRNPGPILFQLPPTFPMNRDRLSEFLKLLPKERRYAIELRDPSWHTEEIYNLLKSYNVAFCLFDTADGISTRKLTANFAYVRLRGREEKNLAGFLSEWKDWLSDHTEDAYVFFHNREEKRLAFGNALIFRDMVAV